jgi:hypothetical protein
METKHPNGPAESPVPGVIPAAPHVEADHEGTQPEPPARLDDAQPPSVASESAHRRGPAGALLARILRKER